MWGADHHNGTTGEILQICHISGILVSTTDNVFCFVLFLVYAFGAMWNIQKFALSISPLITLTL